MITVVKHIERVKISYDGYEFCFFIPEGYDKEIMNEWRERNKENIKKVKKELKDEHEKKNNKK